MGDNFQYYIFYYIVIIRLIMREAYNITYSGKFKFVKVLDMFMRLLIQDDIIIVVFYKMT